MRWSGPYRSSRTAQFCDSEGSAGTHGSVFLRLRSFTAPLPYCVRRLLVVPRVDLKTDEIQAQIAAGQSGVSDAEKGVHHPADALYPVQAHAHLR